MSSFGGQRTHDTLHEPFDLRNRVVPEGVSVLAHTAVLVEEPADARPHASRGCQVSANTDRAARVSSPPQSAVSATSCLVGSKWVMSLRWPIARTRLSSAVCGTAGDTL
jgi:hypothetical protein